MAVAGRGAVILDGTALAAARAPGLAVRGEQVAERLGRRPRLVLVAFADAAGGAPYVDRKIGACRAAGVEVIPLILAAGTPSPSAERALAALLSDEVHDAVFLESPFPDDIDGAALIALIPAAADVDIMSPGRVAQFFSGQDAPPPLTVAAGLALLDGYGVEVAGRRGVIVGQEDGFTRMFREALARRGALMSPIVSPDALDLLGRVAELALVVAAASRPGLLESASLAPGAVAIDVGYFNPGGRGDIDLSGGVGHLAAIAPVPGGIGPMTVSSLVERVITEASATPRSGR